MMLSLVSINKVWEGYYVFISVIGINLVGVLVYGFFNY